MPVLPITSSTRELRTLRFYRLQLTTTDKKMRLSVGAARPCTLPSTTITSLSKRQRVESLLLAHCNYSPSSLRTSLITLLVQQRPFNNNYYQKHYSGAVRCSAKVGKKWMEYQGINNWDGLLDPLDDNLRSEILRYGQFVEAAYRSFDFDPASPTYATSKFPRNSLLSKSGIGETGYRTTKNLRATCGVRLPRWIDRAPSWVSTQSSWIGYVAVCQDKEEISRLGRRDVVIAYRGTATCLEWLENLRATLTCLPDDVEGDDNNNNNKTNVGSANYSIGPMVERGFLSLYTSGTATCPSLQSMVREEIKRVLEMYGDEPLSFTITGHSLGAALATLTAYDINSTFCHAPMVTVISFGGPRVGNRSFRCHLEKSGTRILRIVNSDDVITKVPGFAVDNNDVAGGVPHWLRKRVECTPWGYAEVGQELRLSSKMSPYLSSKRDVATCHELSTYLHLISGFESSTCPFKATAKKMLNRHHKEKLGLIL